MKNNNTITISLPTELEDILPKEKPLLLDWETAQGEISNKAGLYAFWWHGPHEVLNGDQEVEFTGPAFQKIDDAVRRLRAIVGIGAVLPFLRSISC